MKWECSCGQINSGARCVKCGAPRENGIELDANYKPTFTEVDVAAEEAKLDKKVPWHEHMFEFTNINSGKITGEKEPDEEEKTAITRATVVSLVLLGIAAIIGTLARSEVLIFVAFMVIMIFGSPKNKNNTIGGKYFLLAIIVTVVSIGIGCVILAMR